MSAIPTSPSPDLERLRREGYEIEILAGHLLVRNVPYVDAARTVRQGVLVSTLDLAGEVTAPPQSHVAYFIGDKPCDAAGRVLDRLCITGSLAIRPGLVAEVCFSSKPEGGKYPDYHEKMTSYVELVAGHAQAIDPNVTARTFAVVENHDEGSPFIYTDTASSRAGIAAVSRKLAIPSVAIVGLGGTGSYVLDLVAKTPVGTIHLFDGDAFLQHNAFRAPGAATLEELRERRSKVERFRSVYSRMHGGIVAHPTRLTADNVDLLRDMAFVFLCLDAGDAKRAIIEALERAGTPFIDVGIGVDVVDGAVNGVVRVTTSTRAMRDHVRGKGRIPMTGGGGDDAYARNIQIADLNALNAALAVIRWKKLLGFYADLEGEHFSAYSVDGNHLLNEDAA